MKTKNNIQAEIFDLFIIVLSTAFSFFFRIEFFITLGHLVTFLRRISYISRFCPSEDLN